MAITLEAIRAAGGIVHSDGNIFFRDISMLQGLAGAAPAAVAPRGEYPHEQMDAMALARYKVAPSHASMLWSHAVVAGDGAQQLYVGREVECQNMARKFAGAFLDGAFAFHSMAAAPTAQAAPSLEAPAAPVDDRAEFEKWARQQSWIKDCQRYDDGRYGHYETEKAWATWQARAALAAAPQAPAAPSAVATQVIENLLQLARIVNTAVEDWGETKEDDSLEVIFHKEEADKLEEILEFFDSLPDAPESEGVILSGPSRAARVLRATAAPAAPAVDAALNALIADVRALPTLRASEIDGEESDGTPKHWRNRPFVSLRKLELLLRDRVTASSDTALLNFIAAEYLDLRSFGMPTGQGDADVGWRVIQHHMGEPTERVVAEVYKDDPRSAIRAAIARLERDPYCTGALHEEDAAQAREGGAA